jgi:phenylalanyl-tRNA synthetase beta chain
MITEIAGGKISSSVIDIYPHPVKEAIVSLSYSHLNTFSGITFDKKIVREILLSLGMKILKEDNDMIRVDIPHYRVEVRRPADVIEEILRVYGYDRIPVPQKLNAPLPGITGTDREAVYTKVNTFLAANGFNEIMTNSLTRMEYTSFPSWSAERAVKILNPLSQELSVMRQSLLEGGLETVQYNRNRKNADLRFFELGKIYHANDSKYSEGYRLSLLITGNRNGESWNAKPAKTDFYLLKGILSNLLAACSVESVKMKEGDRAEFSSSLKISSGNIFIGETGAVSKTILRKFDITDDVFYAEIDMDALIIASRKTPVQYSEVSRFPPVRRDLSMLIGNEISYSQLQNIAFNTERKLLKDIRLFDIYEGDKIADGKKSYALSFILQDDQQTLTDQQIVKVMDKLMAAFEKEAGAEIRKA